MEIENIDCLIQNVICIGSVCSPLSDFQVDVMVPLHVPARSGNTNFPRMGNRRHAGLQSLAATPPTTTIRKVAIVDDHLRGCEAPVETMSMMKLRDHQANSVSVTSIVTCVLWENTRHIMHRRDVRSPRR